tara:strand:- start:1511 stop:1639 length:129 start_codon:yes stop_codon:yes gene_type:complete
MEATLKKCITKAIREFGLENFKKTSMFLSNESKAEVAYKEAA